ncbi:MAG TPA: class I SAM-dependent methyltransferase [Blastocatellia bacterium]
MLIDSLGRAGSLPAAQLANEEWWTQNPMTYDWQGSLGLESGSREWFEEIDRRFFSSAYYAQDQGSKPFGRFLRPGLVAGRPVLEVGCGMGSHAALLARAGAALTAVDLTARAVETTRRRFELFGLSGLIERADAENLPFPDEQFDLAWSWGVIHHSRSMEACLAEMTRVVKAGGRLLLMVYYRPSLVYYVHCGLIRGILLGKFFRQSLQQIYVDSSDGFYARVFTKRELRSLLSPDYEQVSMSVVGLKPELLPIPRNSFKEKLERIIPDGVASAVLGRWGSMIVVEAVKRHKSS